MYYTNEVVTSTYHIFNLTLCVTNQLVFNPLVAECKQLEDQKYSYNKILVNMAFLSDLKKAYDSIGTELSKTFDSSYTEEDKSSTPDDLEPATTPVHSKQQVQDESSYYATPMGNSATKMTSEFHDVPLEDKEDNHKGLKSSADVNDGWGQWDTLPQTRGSLSPASSAVKQPQTQVSQAVKKQRLRVADESKGNASLGRKEGTDSGCTEQTPPKSPIATSTPAKIVSPGGQGKSQVWDCSQCVFIL